MTLTGASKAKLKVTDYRKLIMFSKRVDRGRCTGVVARGTGRFWSWLDDHVLTYVGLSAPLLGAVNPIKAVVSGESMGLPMSPPGRSFSRAKLRFDQQRRYDKQRGGEALGRLLPRLRAQGGVRGGQEEGNRRDRDGLREPPRVKV